MWCCWPLPVAETVLPPQTGGGGRGEGGGDKETGKEKREGKWEKKDTEKAREKERRVAGRQWVGKEKTLVHVFF